MTPKYFIVNFFTMCEKCVVKRYSADVRHVIALRVICPEFPEFCIGASAVNLSVSLSPAINILSLTSLFQLSLFLSFLLLPDRFIYSIRRLFVIGPITRANGRRSHCNSPGRVVIRLGAGPLKKQCLICSRIVTALFPPP